MDISVRRDTSALGYWHKLLSGISEQNVLWTLLLFGWRIVFSVVLYTAVTSYVNIMLLKFRKSIFFQAFDVVFL